MAEGSLHDVTDSLKKSHWDFAGLRNYRRPIGAYTRLGKDDAKLYDKY
jgi:hypothetical protein